MQPYSTFYSVPLHCFGNLGPKPYTIYVINPKGSQPSVKNRYPDGNYKFPHGAICIFLNIHAFKGEGSHRLTNFSNFAEALGIREPRTKVLSIGSLENFERRSTLMELDAKLVLSALDKEWFQGFYQLFKGLGPSKVLYINVFILWAQKQYKTSPTYKLNWHATRDHPNQDSNEAGSQNKKQRCSIIYVTFIHLFYKPECLPGVINKRVPGILSSALMPRH